MGVIKRIKLKKAVGEHNAGDIIDADSASIAALKLTEHVDYEPVGTHGNKSVPCQLAHLVPPEAAAKPTD